MTPDERYEREWSGDTPRRMGNSAALTAILGALALFWLLVVVWAVVVR